MPRWISRVLDGGLTGINPQPPAIPNRRAICHECSKGFLGQTGDDMNISARNVLKGKIVDITKGATTAHVKIDIGGGAVVTSSITNAAVDDLKLAVGKDAYAIVKASDVMIGTD
jgi:molybdopterin-binding protein